MKYIYHESNCPTVHLRAGRGALCSKSFKMRPHTIVTDDMPERSVSCVNCLARAKQYAKSRTKKKSDQAKKETNKAFYASWEWKELRYKVLMKCGRKCMCCGDHPPHARLVVDHIKPRSKYPSLELDESNCQVLCNACNMGKSDKDETDFR